MIFFKSALLGTSDVNKDLGLKAKDLDPKAKDLSHKAKDLGHKAKAKDSRYQGQIFLVGSVERFSARVRFDRSSSSKVIDFGTNRKHICDFLLVHHTNLGHVPCPEQTRFLKSNVSLCLK